MTDSIEDLIATIRGKFVDLNPPCDEYQVALLESSVGTGLLPDDVIRLYESHNGENPLHRTDGRRLPVRLMSVEEVAQYQQTERYRSEPRLGKIAWIFVDFDSNYAGVYLDGPCRGAVIKYEANNWSFELRYRSVVSFLAHLVASQSDASPATDLIAVPAELPVMQDEPLFVESDDETAALLERAMSEQVGEARRLYAFSALRLLPVRSSERAIRYLLDKDPWIQEYAIRLLDSRNVVEVIPRLSEFVAHGDNNPALAATSFICRAGQKELLSALPPDRQKFVEVPGGQKTPYQWT